MAWRSWLILGAAVAAVHGWLLGAVITPLQVGHAAAVPTFITRSLAGAPPQATAPARPERRAEPARLSLPAALPATPRELKSMAFQVPAAAPEPGPELTTVALTKAPHEPVHAAAAAVPATPTLRFGIPGSARLHYAVTASVHQIRLQGEGELAWQHDGTSYDARLEISSPLLPRRIQHSAGLITAEGLAPVRFSDKARSEEAAHFQHDQGKVTFSSNKPDAPLLPGMQDRLSVMLQLGAMVAGAPAKFPAGTVISIPTASTREAEPWQFTVEGHDELELPGGKVAALKLIRNPRREFDQKVELWLATGMDYVPVRLRLTQANGDWVDQQWSSTDKR